MVSPMPDDMTLEEFEAVASEPAKPEVDKTVELQEQINKLQESLRVSEAARLAVAAAAPTAPAAPKEPEPTPVVPKTREEIAAMFQEDPVGAIEYVQNLTLNAVAQHVDSRVSPLANSALNAQEIDARNRYKTEFELFGDDIKKMAEQVPDRSVLTNPAAWDDLVTFVRGKSGNLEKYIAHVTQNNRDTARNEQIGGTGFTGRSGPSRITDSGGDGYYGLDAVQREIADIQGISYADYAKWNKVNNG